ncbi:MAG: tRNA 5-methoxyuridine(34)/uridine 5-oxyacetic acid(34) synthase CmoB [Lysobacterales bacterium]
MKNPYLQLQASAWPELAALGWQHLKTSSHGDLPRWLEIIDGLDEGDGYCQLDRQAPVLGRPVSDPARLRQQLLGLHPWRKGPLEPGGISIDTEWRSDWKWERLSPHLDLVGQRILDIGCGNGYFGYRMLAKGAELVLGIDPTLVFVMQWLAMQKLCPGLNNFVLPLGIEDLAINTTAFDSVFSMGVLYHRRKPVEHLEQLKKLTRPGGNIVLETLVLEDTGREILNPADRYARMRNVHSIPSLTVLHEWLGQAGLADAKVLDVSKTTTEEQRSTDWMTFESLRECLDVNDPSVTVEGYPAPVRAAFLIKVSEDV